MRTALLLAVAMVTVSSLPGMARQSAAAAQESAAASAAGAQSGVPGHATAQAGMGSAASLGTGAEAAENLRPVKGELIGKLDSKSARVGERVVVETKAKMQTAGGIVIPKGARLMGHVTAVQAHGSGNEDSSMGILFDRAEWKGGQGIAIRSVIESVAPPASLVPTSPIDKDDPFNASLAPLAPAGGGVLGEGRVGASGLGRAMNGAASGPGRVNPNLGSSLGSTATAAVRTRESLAGKAAAGAAGSAAAHATAIPGVMLNGDATGSASGTLTAAKRDVHLASGTQMVLGIAAVSK